VGNFVFWRRLIEKRERKRIVLLFSAFINIHFCCLLLCERVCEKLSVQSLSFFLLVSREREREMWSDDNMADSILENIGHAESVMSDRDVTETYDRSLKVMVGSLSCDNTFDRVLDALNSYSPKRKRSPRLKRHPINDDYFHDDKGVLKFDDLYITKRNNKVRSKRKSSPKKKKKRSKRRTSNRNDRILFSHFRAKAVLFRRWRKYSEKRKLVRKVISIFELSARKGRLFRACVKWTLFTMESRERDRELDSKQEILRSKHLNPIRKRSYLLRWRDAYRTRDKTARFVSERRRQTVMRCFLRVWNSRIPNTELLRCAREFRHRKVLLQWHRRSRFAARKRDAEIKWALVRAAKALRTWKIRAEQRRERRIQRSEITARFLRTSRLRRGLRVLIREGKLRRRYDAVRIHRIRTLWNQWILASQSLRLQKKERLRQILERVFRSGERGQLYDAMCRWRRICRVQNMIAVSMLKSDRAVKTLRFRVWRTHVRRVRRIRDLSRVVSGNQKRALQVMIMSEWRKARKLRYVTRKIESQRREKILFRWRKKFRLRSIIGYASRIRERDKLEALIRWRRAARRMRVIEFWNLSESFERWTRITRLHGTQQNAITLSWRVSAMRVGRTLRNVRRSRVSVFRVWFSKWLDFMSNQARDRVVTSRCRAIIKKRVLGAWRRSLFVQRIRLRRKELIDDEGKEELVDGVLMDGNFSSLSLRDVSSSSSSSSSMMACRSPSRCAHRISPPSKQSPLRFRAPPCFDVFTTHGK